MYHFIQKIEIKQNVSILTEVFDSIKYMLKKDNLFRYKHRGVSKPTVQVEDNCFPFLGVTDSIPDMHIFIHICKSY